MKKGNTFMTLDGRGHKALVMMIVLVIVVVIIIGSWECLALETLMVVREYLEEMVNIVQYTNPVMEKTSLKTVCGCETVDKVIVGKGSPG